VRWPIQNRINTTHLESRASSLTSSDCFKERAMLATESTERLRTRYTFLPRGEVAINFVLHAMYNYRSSNDRSFLGFADSARPRRSRQRWRYVAASSPTNRASARSSVASRGPTHAVDQIAGRSARRCGGGARALDRTLCASEGLRCSPPPQNISTVSLQF